MGITTESTPGLSSHSLRFALLLALLGQAFVLLATFGVLNGATMAVAFGAAFALTRPQLRFSWWMLAFLPLMALAAYPPLAFDETLYHLPYIERLARTGTIGLYDDIRFGVFPLLHELLCVPLFVAFGPTATHFVAVLQLAILGGLLVEWPDRRDAGWLAAAMVLGNPALIGVSAVVYVETALTLFVAAGFFCLQRERRFHPLLAGFFLGTAISVKYLGILFAAAGLLYAWRSVPRYVAGVAIGATPMIARIAFLTGNPLHPFFVKSDWAVATPLADIATQATRLLRLFYDITFDRARAGEQPPYTLFFAIALFIAVVLARHWRLGAICLAYLVAFVVLMPVDSRYLLPLAPLVSIPAATYLAERVSKRTLVAIAIVAALPLLLYPAYWIARRGWPYDVRERITALRALERKGEGRVYVCGAEELKWFGGDELIGDHYGPYAYEKVFNGGLETLDARWFVVSKRHCRDAWRNAIAAHAERVYEDPDAELWRR
ncbi:MAG TPA: phospholipid carrier-dependent glycosyltransferase [Thermoanaerobaculia bacterium]